MTPSDDPGILRPMERGLGLRGQESAGLDVRVRREMRERQKRERRGERDRVVLEIAQSLGVEGLARSLGTSPETAEELVQRARARAAAAPREITARRAGRDPERWSEADRHFEELGRSARLAPPPFGGS